MSGEPGPDSRPRLGPGLRLQWEEAQGCHVLLYPEGMVKLNPSAAEIVHRCDGQRTLAQIVAELETAFTKDHFNAKHLARAIVLSDELRAVSDDDPVDAEAVIGYQKLRPAQLRRMLRDLTGFEWRGTSHDVIGGRWQAGPFDYLDDDTTGYRVLAGGIDSFFVTEPVHTMTATASLVVRTAAGKAAQYVVSHDRFAPASARTLFTESAVTDTAEVAVRAQLAALHGRIYGELVLPDDERVTETYALFERALAASHDPARAWIITLTGMLSDLRAVYY